MALTNKQEKFVQGLVKGLSQRQAYKESYNAENMKDKTIDDRAFELFKKSEIKERYNELMGKLEKKAIMSAEKRMQWLSDVIEGNQKESRTYFRDGEAYESLKEADINTKIKALDTLNKMDNVYQQNINVNGTINNPYKNLSEEELRKLAE